MASLTAEETRVQHLKTDISELVDVLKEKPLSKRNKRFIEKYVGQLEKELKELENKMSAEDEAADDGQAPEGYVAMNDEGNEANDVDTVASTVPAAKKPRTVPAIVGNGTPFRRTVGTKAINLLQYM